MKIQKIIFIIILSVIGLGLAIGTIWILDSSKPMAEALTALESDEKVEVSTDQWIEFSPKNTDPKIGVIFYPGGKVEPESYAPLIKQIAEAGFLAIIVPMALNLAFTGINKAESIIAEYPEIDSWVMSGHSLGGSMAAKFTYDHPDMVDGLILLASYPADSNNLSSSAIPCLSIYGSEDSVLSKDIPSTISLLPNNSTIYKIEGGNHAFFGYYGEQKGDGIATITREEQQQITLTQIIQLLNLMD